MGCLKRALIVVAVVVAVLILLWFLLLGRGPEPLSLVAQPQRDLIVAVERPVSLFFESAELFQRLGWVKPKDMEDLPPKWVMGMMDVETVAAGMDLPRDESEEPSFVLALKAGRILHFLGKFAVGQKTLRDSGQQVYRFGCTFAIQQGEEYEVKPSEPLPEMPPGRIRALILPQRIEQRLDIALDYRGLDLLRVPWPITSLGLGADIEGGKISIVGQGEFLPARVSRLTSAAIEEEPCVPLAAEYYDPERTIVALSWLAPKGEDVHRVLYSEVWPNDALLDARFTSEVSRLHQQVLPAICGKRATLLIYHQDNRIKPGYPGVVFVQELKPDHGWKNYLRLLVNAISKGIVDEGTAPPSEYPYFEHREAQGGVPEHYAYYSDMVRRNEGYQPTLALADDRLVYASSPAALKTLIDAPGLRDVAPAHSWLHYSARGKEAVQQLDNMYRFFHDETKAARRTEDELKDTTDYQEVFEEFKKALELVQEADVGLTIQRTGDFSLRASVVPGEGKP